MVDKLSFARRLQCRHCREYQINRASYFTKPFIASITLNHGRPHPQSPNKNSVQIKCPPPLAPRPLHSQQIPPHPCTTTFQTPTFKAPKLHVSNPVRDPPSRIRTANPSPDPASGALLRTPHRNVASRLTLKHSNPAISSTPTTCSAFGSWPIDLFTAMTSQSNRRE